MTNTIRPGDATSLLIRGEVRIGARAKARGLPEVCETPTGCTINRSETRLRKSVTLGGQRRSDDRARGVVGDGMQGRSCHVNQGDLYRQRWVFIAREKGTKSPLCRSQSTRSSEEAGQCPWSEGVQEGG
jgi:hypothetical protein